MNKLILRTTARVMAIVFALFLSIFAFDAFDVGFWKGILGFLIHLVPVYIIVAMLIVAWKWERIGGMGFLIAGLFFVVFFNLYKDLISFLIVGLPAIIIGVLFILSNYYNKKKRKRRKKR